MNECAMMCFTANSRLSLASITFTLRIFSVKVLFLLSVPLFFTH